MKRQALLILLAASSALAQGTFQNLDFEDANLLDTSGQFGGLVSSLDAIPGWTAYYGNVQTSQVLQNNETLGNVNISILGPNWNFTPILQGKYSVLLQAGLVLSTTPTPAAIAQTGAIPVTALSLQLLASQVFGATFGTTIDRLQVSFNGQNLSLIPLSSTSNSILYGTDVSTYAGTTGELRISALPGATYSHNSFLIDSIEFSPVAIPEPAVLTLAALGTGFLIWRLRHRTRLP